MKRVFVCSQLRGNYQQNIANAQLYAKYVLSQGFLPVVPHLYLPQFLDDGDVKQRALGMRLGRVIMRSCHKFWVFGNVISVGMEGDVRYWLIKLKRPLIEFKHI